MAQKKIYFQFKPDDRLLLEKYAENIPTINHDDSIDLKAKKILLIAINAKKPAKTLMDIKTGDFLDSIL